MHFFSPIPSLTTTLALSFAHRLSALVLRPSRYDSDGGSSVVPLAPWDSESPGFRRLGAGSRRGPPGTKGRLERDRRVTVRDDGPGSGRDSGRPGRPRVPFAKCRPRRAATVPAPLVQLLHRGAPASYQHLRGGPGAVAAWPPPGGPHWALRGRRPSIAAAARPALALRLRPIIVAILAMCCALPVNRRIQLGRVRRFRVKFRQVRARGTQVGTHIAASVLCTEMQPRPWALRAGLCCHSVVSRGLRLSLMGT